MQTKVSRKMASVEAVLRGGHENDKGELPVRIRVTYDRKTKYYPVNFEGTSLYLERREWETLKNKDIKVRGIRKKKKEAWEDCASLARSATKKITDNGQPFTIDRFEAEYLVQESKKGFLGIFRDHLEELLKEERIGTYKSYQNAFTAFNKFRGAVYKSKAEILKQHKGETHQNKYIQKELDLNDQEFKQFLNSNVRETFQTKKGKELNPIDITPTLLKDFDKYMQKERKAGINTVAMYMRGLKVVYNICLDRNPSLSEFYPFARKQNDKKRYSIRTFDSHKGDALSIFDFKKFKAIKATSMEHEAKLYWLFSFYCRGMNPRDIFFLKNKDIDFRKGIITYVREKTKGTKKIIKTFRIPLTDYNRPILEELENEDKRPTAYTFNVLKNGEMSPLDIDKAIKQKIKIIDKWLKRLCLANDLPEVTMYWARHTYSNFKKISGTSTEEIRELLGHGDLKTTEAYLKRLPDEHTRKGDDDMFSKLG